MYDEHLFDATGWSRHLRRDVNGWTAAEIGAGLRALAGMRAALDACEARLLARFDGTEGWKADGAANAAAWLREHTGSSQRDATQRVHTADGLSTLPAVADALADGMITHQHAATLARAAARAPALADDQGELLRRAVGQSADAFEKTVRSWELRRQADHGAAQFERQHARRSVTMSKVDDGMTLVQARLDPVAGETVTTALDRITEELWRRDSGQARVVDLHVRRADALVELARRAMAVDPTTAKKPDPLLMILVDHETLRGELTEAGVCELADSTPLAPATARRLACSAGILPVVLDGKSRPLDLGVAQRYASPAQRLALTIRDGGCVFPGCDRPHWMCDAHHLLEHPVGPTNLENLALVCETHHHTVHEGGWNLSPTDEGGWIARGPAGLQRTRLPRRQRPPDPPAPSAPRRGVDQHDAGQLELLAS
jgi:hypothetical protein